LGGSAGKKNGEGRTICSGRKIVKRRGWLGTESKEKTGVGAGKNGRRGQVFCAQGVISRVSGKNGGLDDGKRGKRGGNREAGMSVWDKAE